MGITKTLIRAPQEENRNFFDYNLVLQNPIVRLRAINFDDLENLIYCASEPEIWTYYAYKMSDPKDMIAYTNEALLQRQLGLRYTFIIEDIVTKDIIGSTALGNYSEDDKRIEIGWSWIKRNFQGSEVNKNVKFLLLKFAFEYLNIERVEFKTDVLNQRARHALIKIGASEEGVLRSHTLMPGNRRRDTVYYSILRNEWGRIRSSIFPECSFSIMYEVSTKEC